MGCNTTIGLYTPGPSPVDWGTLSDLDDEFPGGDLRGCELGGILSGRADGGWNPERNPWRPAVPRDEYCTSFHYDVELLRANVRRAYPEGHALLERFVDAAEAAQKKYGADRAVITHYL